MELADESPDGWPFRQYVASNCSSPSIGGISAVTNSSGNPFSLFYSPTNNCVHNNVIQSSRASNSWIASLRSNNERGQSSSLISTNLDSRQHHYELPNRHDASRINYNETGVIHGRSFSIGRLPPTSHSLPSSSSRHWGSLDSIHRNQRLKQLAAQSTTKVRSLSARESTAAAERWRYIQTVLERRRKESLEHRERFIRQPLDNIIRKKAINRSVAEQGPPSWHSIVSGRSILKRRTANWRMKANRRVRFNTIQQDEMEECDDIERQDRGKLPIIPIAEETEASRNESPMAEQVDRRLPPLMIPSSGCGITVDGAGDDTSQLLSPSGPSWVERQVAKVRQRKMWAFRQQQQQLNLDQSPRVVLKRSISMVVNVPDADDRHSSDEEENDRSLIELEQITRNQCLTWEVMLDKDELLDTPNGHEEDEPTADYCGWPHFPLRLAVRIQTRQQRLKERKTTRKEKNINRNDGIANPNNSFIRRKRFGEKLSIALIRQRKRNIIERIPSSSGRKPVDQLANGSNAKTTNAEEKINSASIVQNPIADASDVDHRLTDAISLQIPVSPDEISSHFLSIHPDVVATIPPNKEFDDIHMTVSTRSSSSSDAISEADVPQTAMNASSVGLETDEETIIADVYYHLEGLIPVADVMVKKIDDRLDETAASAFCLPSACCRQEEITDESISDVTVDDGPHLIDQLRDTSATIPATSEEYEAGMASEPDAIPSDIFTTEQTEHGITSPFHSSDGTNKGSPVRRRRPAYCSAWPLVISNQNSDAVPPNPVTLSYWNNLQDPTSEKTVVHQPEAGISSDLTSFCFAPENDPANPAEFMVMKNALDKKTKDAHNESRILFPSRSSIPTQTEPQPSPRTKEFLPPEVDELSDPVDAKDVGETNNDCQCLHRAVLTCLLPEAADTLANLELIRRQLKRARIRRQGTEQQRQPLQVRRDVHPGIDPNTQRP